MLEILVIVLIAFTALAMLIAIISLIISLSRKREPKKIHRDLKTIEGLVDSMRRKGMSDTDILAKLKGSGWQEHVVELVLHEAHKPNDKLEKLQNYVNKQLEKGSSPDIIKEDLLETGWSEPIIDLVLGLD